MAKDLHHETVKNALEKDGWRITHDPFVLKYKDLTVFADLGAEKIFIQNQNESKIIVEIKVFGGKSKTTEFEKAKGQYDVYLFAMQKIRSSEFCFWQFQPKFIKVFFCDLRFKRLLQKIK